MWSLPAARNGDYRRTEDCRGPIRPNDEDMAVVGLALGQSENDEVLFSLERAHFRSTAHTLHYGTRRSEK